MGAHGTTSRPGPTSYGYQMAAAAAEFVLSPISSARTDTSNPFSAKRIPQVRPETPAPTMATLRFILLVELRQASRSGGLRPPFYLVGDFKSPLLEAASP